LFLEPMYLGILIGSLLVTVAIFTSIFSFRLGAPLLLIFLVIGLLAGEDGPGGIVFDNSSAAFFIGSMALALILFDAGLETRRHTLRGAAGQALALSTIGVLLTALVIAVAVRLIFGFSWLECLLVGAIVSPTDAAAVFLLLRVGGITVRERVRATLEVESGSNDPMAIFLTIALVEIIGVGSSEGQAIFELVRQFLLQIGFGLVLGLVAGSVLVQIVNRTNFEIGLYPILVLAFALSLFSFTALVGGSGFLAVFVAGVWAGNARMRHKIQLRRFSNGVTWLAQIAMFLLLGLLATPSEFAPALLPAIALSLILILIARPLAIWLCLVPFGFNRREIAFIAWVGLRGAVSILLAIVPMLGGIGVGREIFNTTFIVVIASLLLQGWTIGPVARRLGLIVPPRHGVVDRIELELPGRGDHEIVAYTVHPESPVAKGERIPRWARPSLIVRDGRSLRPHNYGRPQPDDRVYILTTPDYIELLDHLFAGPAEGATDPALYGEFMIDSEAPLADIAATYGAVIPADATAMTIRQYLRRELSGDIEQGDRVSLGPVDIIVRGVTEEHEIEEVGIAVDPEHPQKPEIPLFQSPKEIAAFMRRLGRRKAFRKVLPAPPEEPKSEAGPPEKT
jgi:cell volume regulation protein A